MSRQPYDDGARDYEQRKQRVVNAVIYRITHGDPRDPITQRLRRMAGLDTDKGKGDGTADHKPAGDDT